MWSRRAQRYFDGRDVRVPYIRHRYTMDSLFPYTYGDQNILFTRRTLSFNDRNPRVPDYYHKRILNNHLGNPPGDHEFDIYSMYESREIMTRSEFYIESHIDQFYRVLFFIQELRSCGILSDDDDTFDGPLPYHVMMEYLQEIVYDDAKYRHYLSKRRSLEVRSTDFEEDDARKSLKRSARVREEDLFLLLKKNFLSKNIGNVTTTTTERSTSTTMRYGNSGKGSVYVNENGKNFLKRPIMPEPSEKLEESSVCVNKKGKDFSKRPRTTFPDSCCENNDQKMGTRDLNKFTKSCLRRRFNYLVTEYRDNVLAVCSILRQFEKLEKIENKIKYYGYVVESDNHNQILLSKEESSVILRDLLSMVSVSCIHQSLRRR